MKRIAVGNKAAFQDLYRDLERPVFRFIRSRLNDPFEAHDILHDVFMEIWRNADRFEGRSKVQTWVMGIAYRKTIDALRKRGRIDLPGEEMPDQVDDSVDTEACVLAGQEAAHVRFCLDQLSGEQRGAVLLAFFEDLSYVEIASVTGVPEGTVKTRVFHAKKLLLRCLEGRIERRAMP